MSTIGGHHPVGDFPTLLGRCRRSSPACLVPGQVGPPTRRSARPSSGTRRRHRLGDPSASGRTAHRARRPESTSTRTRCGWQVSGQQLNGIDNVTWLRGQTGSNRRHGEHFDLVTVNPPVTISPDEHCPRAASSPIGGTELSRQMVSEAADHLADARLCHGPVQLGPPRRRLGGRSSGLGGAARLRCGAADLRQRGTPSLRDEQPPRASGSGSADGRDDQALGRPLPSDRGGAHCASAW